MVIFYSYFGLPEGTFHLGVFELPTSSSCVMMLLDMG
jgi:hypothetical protein